VALAAVRLLVESERQQQEEGPRARRLSDLDCWPPLDLNVHMCGPVAHDAGGECVTSK